MGICNEHVAGLGDYHILAFGRDADSFQYHGHFEHHSFHKLALNIRTCQGCVNGQN
jgi:hypothetical protein